MEDRRLTRNPSTMRCPPAQRCLPCYSAWRRLPGNLILSLPVYYSTNICAFDSCEYFYDFKNFHIATTICGQPAGPCPPQARILSHSYIGSDFLRPSTATRHSRCHSTHKQPIPRLFLRSRTPHPRPPWAPATAPYPGAGSTPRSNDCKPTQTRTTKRRPSSRPRATPAAPSSPYSASPARRLSARAWRTTCHGGGSRATLRASSRRRCLCSCSCW